jgi:signal transduction histidine kinase
MTSWDDTVDRRPALTDPSAWYGAAYQVLSIPVGVCCTVLTGLAITGLAAIPGLLIGIPLLVGCLLVARGPLAAVERARGKAFLGPDLLAGIGPAAGTGRRDRYDSGRDAAATGELTAPGRRPIRRTGWRRWLLPRTLGDPAAWKALAYAAIVMFWGLLTGPIVLVLAAGGLALALVPLQRLVANRTPIGVPGTQEKLFYALPVDSLTLWSCAVIGVLALLAVPYLGRGLAVIDRALIRSLLGPGRPDRYAEEVRRLEASRERAVQGAEAERRRIERDLHDGAQQRLIALAMELGRARQKLSSSPDTAQELLDNAHQEAKAAIRELRDVARGIHPAVLTDRGLDAAMSALAARCPVPVDVTVDVDPRPPEVIEATAYFITAEALTNVAKHAGAGRAAVRLRTERGTGSSDDRLGGGRRRNPFGRDRRPADRGVLLVEISDDGAGGATATPGGGLSGLADRVASVDGTLWLSSPPGGGTELTAELPYVIAADRSTTGAGSA